jgi:enoyl-CoA hydratase/carnithine racemase
METLLDFEFMRLEKEDKLAWVTFTRERYLNAMSNACTIQINEVAGSYLAACSLGTRMSKLVVNQAFDMDYETILPFYFDLQKRAQYNPDAEEAKRAYRANRTPKWQ